MNEASTYRQNEVKGIWTGALNITNISEIRFMNAKNYVNKLVPVNNGKPTDSITYLPVSPGATIAWEPSTAFKTLTHVSNGVQYSPEDESTQSNTVYMYEPRFLDFVEYSEVNVGDDSYGNADHRFKVRSY
jgi:hypothetical protein